MEMKALVNYISFMRVPVVIVFLLVLIHSCEKSDSLAGYPEELFKKTRYNLDMKDFVMAVRNSINDNTDFRLLLKDEALKMFDGDYDVLMSDIVDKELQTDGVSAGSKSGSVTVRALLESNLSDSHLKSDTKSEGSYIDQLIDKYPYLQISVPVNAEKWDGNYKPMVTFIPEEFDEATTMEVTAYTATGETVTLDAVNPPSEPVLVVSMNERIDLIEYPEEPVIPPAPSNLRAVITESGIRLTWDIDYSAGYDNTTGYYIYRKSSSDLYYVLRATVPGVYNQSYDDNSINPGGTYSYYVITYFQGETSNPSNIVTLNAPLRPKPVLSFDAIQHSKNVVELRWQNDYSQFISQTRIYKYVLGINSGYELYKTFGPGQSDYFDTDIAIGKKTIYKTVHVSDLGESNPKYDFIHAPYRDISENSPVYIKQIKFTDWSIERWLAGKPEFYITVSNVDQGNKSPFTVQDQINCEFSKRSSTSQVFYGVKVLDWKPGFWYDMLTFTALEYDRPSGTLTVDVGVKFNAKDTLKLGFLEGSAGVNYKIEFSDKGEKCGNSYLNYYDDPETWLSFPNYGVKILVSASDN